MPLLTGKIKVLHINLLITDNNSAFGKASAWSSTKKLNKKKENSRFHQKRDTFQPPSPPPPHPLTNLPFENVIP